MKPSKKHLTSFVQRSGEAKTERESNSIDKRTQLINYWQTIVFLFIAGNLGLLLINTGWVLIDIKQIKVEGSKHLTAKSVVEAGGGILPRTLLKIDPKALEKQLLRALPVKKAVVHREILPPILRIHLQEKELIAYALRQNQNREEKGVLDSEGDWVPLRIANQIHIPEIKITVEGWRESYQEEVGKVLKHRKMLGSPLEKITISPNGALILKTEALGVVQLGANPENLDKQLKALAHLNKSIPEKFKSKPGTILDITDPDKPELQLPWGQG